MGTTPAYAPPPLLPTENLALVLGGAIILALRGQSYRSQQYTKVQEPKATEARARATEGYQHGKRRIVIKPRLKAEPDLEKIAMAIVSDILAKTKKPNSDDQPVL